jgi:hypothetical protein
LGQQLDRDGKLLQVELTVAIGQEHVIHPRTIESRSHRGPVPTIPRVCDDPELRDTLPQTRQDSRGVVGAAVVDDDDLELGSESAADLSSLRHYWSDIALFVETGDHDGQTHCAEPNSWSFPLQTAWCPNGLDVPEERHR